MTKQEIKLYSQDMTCALLEPLNHCSDNDEYMVFLCVFKTILHFSEMYDWIVTIDSKIIPGSSFDLAALNAVIQKNIFSAFFHVSDVVDQLFDRLPHAIQESMSDEFEDTEENSLPADTLE